MSGENKNNGVVAQTDIRLMVDIADKDIAKWLGARWEKDLKTWYAPKGSNLSDFNQFLGEKIVALKDTKLYINFAEKDDAKSLGAWWDSEKKEWLIKAGSDIKNIPEKYFKESNLTKLITNETTFMEFAESKGLIIDELQANGELHRVPVAGGKPHAKDGAYVYFDDNYGKAGWVQNFKTGESEKYGEYNGEPASVIKEYISKERSDRKEEKAISYNEVAKKSAFLISQVFKNAKDHPCLAKKDIKAHSSVKIDESNGLIIPLYNIEGKIRTFQRIDEEGNKIFVRGGEKSGNFYQFAEIKKDNPQVIICEGYSTGASIYEATKIPTIVAMDSGNLEKVSSLVREKYGDSCHITIAADNDHKSDKNIGIESANKAAEKIGATVIIPRFTDEEMKQGYTDFNDYAKANGKLKLKEEILKGDTKLILHQKQKEIER